MDKMFFEKAMADRVKAISKEYGYDDNTAALIVLTGTIAKLISYQHKDHPAIRIVGVVDTYEQN